MPGVPFKVKAVFEYKSEEADDLSFDNGQIITVTEEEDDDWYTGEYTDASGSHQQGLFPRNFVEKYEPAIPSRPKREPKKAAAPELQPVAPLVHDEEAVSEPPAPAKHEEVEAPKAKETAPPPPQVSAVQPAAEDPQDAPGPAPAQTRKPGPPPAAPKPSSNAFKDRIAAFNKTAAPPPMPKQPQNSTTPGYTPGRFQANTSNVYVPPIQKQQPPPIKARKPDEDTGSGQRQPPPPPVNVGNTVEDEDQPKPMTLKERIAAIKRQQELDAASHLDEETPREVPAKKAPQKAPEVAEAAEDEDQTEQRQPVPKISSRKSTELDEDESEDAGPMRQPSVHSLQKQPRPPRELVSDTNDADDSGAADTEDAQEISTEEERPRSKGRIAPADAEPTIAIQQVARDHYAEPRDDAQAEGEDEITEPEETPEEKKRREVRERMARISGAGGAGPFNPFANKPTARRPKPSAEYQRPEPEQEQESSRAAPVNVFGLPGLTRPGQNKPAEPAVEPEDEPEVARPASRDTDPVEDYAQPPKRSATTRSTSSTHERSMPPPPPQREARAPPPPPTSTRAAPELPSSPTARNLPPALPPVRPIGPEHEDEDEDDEDEDDDNEEQEGNVVQQRSAPPPPPNRHSTGPTPLTPVSAPPVPKGRPETPKDVSSSPLTSPQARAPPPPPPNPPSRKNTSESMNRGQSLEETEQEVTAYDGDYDTDIASSAKHKDALKSHNRDSSIDDGVLTDDAAKSPRSPPTRAVPPLPPSTAPRDVPPPPPPTAAPKSRKSMDVPRVAPPPVPPAQVANEEDYDPYRYSAPQHGMPSPPITGAPFIPNLSSPQEELNEDDMYGATSQAPRMPPLPPNDRSAPPPPPSDRPIPPPSMMAGGLDSAPKQSLDVNRSATTARRSMEQSRPSGEQGFIATDIDLGHSSFWWTQNDLPPPALQNRPDVVYEMESSTSSKRGGKSMVSKDVYVLYPDYSQSTINATFDPSNPSHVSFEQSHQRPPPPPRQEQLEAASGQLGAQIASAATSAGTSSSTVGDGSAYGFVAELLKPLTGALKPVSTRSYGALVYANLANASTQQFDEIRAGDIVTFRNAKFSGHKGGLHQKYAFDVGKPDHVGVVLDWDGTKKKIRAWEQRGEEKGKRAKVREESFKMGDLKSGEVRVWRIMPRSYVGWDK